MTDLIKNPMQVSSPLGVFPAKEITVPKKSAAPITKKNAKPADDDEDEDEIEETEEEETEEEEEDEEEEESDDEESEDEEEEDEDEEEEAPKKKKGKGAKKGNLVPREPIKVPKEILKQASSDVKALLKQREAAQEKGDKVELRKIRAKLRALGFRLSTVNSDAPQISKPAAAKKGKKAKDDEDDE